MRELNIFNKNIISWYPFENNKKLLQIGKNEVITNILANKLDYVRYIDEVEDLLNISEHFDYILVYKKETLDNYLDAIDKHLQVDGKVLIINNNDFGINKWNKYDIKNELGIRFIENYEKEKKSINNIKEALKSLKIDNTNVFYVFPNCEEAELIINEKFNLKRDQIERFIPLFKDGEIRIFDEINVLKSIIQADKEMLNFFTDAYIIEASKKEIKNNINYVSFNNVRKEKYRLITILKDDVVEKVADNMNSNIQLKNLEQNIREISKLNIKLLDYEKNGKLYSKLIKDKKTLDVILAEKYQNLNDVAGILKDIQKKLQVDEVEFEYVKKEFKYLDLIDEEKLKRLHFLKRAYIDMIPKNCFLLDNEYVFFDQEWKLECLPVEYITYRAIINSYELVRKIDVNELFEILCIKDYIELFKKIDNDFRQEVIDYKIFEEKYTQNNVKAIENLVNELNMYIENNVKQDEYIKALKEDNTKKQEYIDALENENIKKQEYINKLEKKRRLFFG